MSARAALHLAVRAGSVERDRAREQIVVHLLSSGLRPGTRSCYAVELVIEEWLTNAFRHGAATLAQVTVTSDEEGFELTFEDDGQPFDPAQNPDPVLPRTLDELRPGGLGLYLVRRYARAWRHARERGCNVLVVNIGREDAGSAES